MEGIPMLILSVGGIILMLFFVTYSSQRHNLNSIKDKTVGNGQHGTARWATQQEIIRTYHHVPFTPEQWRQAAREGREPTANGKPLPQGIILGSKGNKMTTALVDSDDVHVLMIAASGAGKTAFFLYPNLEYACASGMSFLALDTKGDLARNYGAIARDIYGYRISVVDLREPTRSDGNNLLTLINRYMDKHREDPRDIAAKAKAEKYAKILAKTIITPEGDNADRGQNAYFYDSAEGLLASVVLLLAEFLPPEETGGYEMRHIASVFKLVQELLMQSSARRGGNQFQELMSLLPADHKAKWLAGSALTASDQGMNSIMSTVLSKDNGGREMKKCILSALAGAMAMLIAIAALATIHANKAQQPKDYEHIDYISNIAAEECYVCGDNGDTLASAYWGEDNVGLINLNNFDLLYLGINRYGDGGELVQEPAGVMLSCGLTDQEADSYAHAYVFPDNAYASLQITGVQYAVDRDSLQNRLCQTCLDSINDLWFTDQPPAEYAIISFEDRTIRPLLNSHPWFASGNYGVDCEFMDNGKIDLLIHYCPNRYE